MWGGLNMGKDFEQYEGEVKFKKYIDGYSKMLTEKTAWGMTEPAMQKDEVRRQDLLNVESLWQSELDKKQSRNYL